MLRAYEETAAVEFTLTARVPYLSCRSVCPLVPRVYGGKTADSIQETM